MTLTLQKINQKTAEVTVEYDGDTAKLYYYPAKVGILSQYRLNALPAECQAAAELAIANGEDEQLAARRVYAGYICEVLASWNIPEYEDGPVIPVTVDNLAQFDMEFLGECIIAIGKDTAPKSTRTPLLAPSASPSRARRRQTSSSRKRG